MSIVPEVGKTYIVEIPWDDTDTNPPKVLVTVAGEVGSATQEYEEGYRFYTDTGMMLFSSGSTTLSDDNPLRLRLKRLAVAEDFKNSFTAFTSVTVATANLLTCSESDRWRAASDSDFRVSLGEVYVNRMGFLQFVRKVRNLSEDPTFVAGGSSFNSKGQYLNSDIDAEQVKPKPSMHDLLYQRL